MDVFYIGVTKSISLSEALDSLAPSQILGSQVSISTVVMHPKLLAYSNMESHQFYIPPEIWFLSRDDQMVNTNVVIYTKNQHQIQLSETETYCLNIATKLSVIFKSHLSNSLVPTIRQRFLHFEDYPLSNNHIYTKDSLIPHLEISHFRLSMYVWIYTIQQFTIVCWC
jgi:hypothetical protein